MLTNQELSKGLDVPRSRVTEWTKRGMPRVSIQAAAAWRLVHARPRKGKAALIAQSRQDKPSDHTPPAIGGDWESRLERCRKTEMEIFDTLRKAMAQGDVNMLGKLQAAHVASIKEIASAEKIALEVRAASKELMHVDEACAALRGILGPLRDSLDKLPIGLRGRCNPEHPEVAQAALTGWVDRVLEAGLHNSEVFFGNASASEREGNPFKKKR